MRRYLQHDAKTGELHLVITDDWQGEHERTVFRVTDQDGRPVRNFRELDGLMVLQDWGPSGVQFYVLMGVYKCRRNVTVEPQAMGPTEHVACKRLASKSKRAKCALCV